MATQLVTAIQTHLTTVQAHLTDLHEQYLILRQSLAPLNLTTTQIIRLLLAQAYRETPTPLKLFFSFLFGVTLLLLLDTYLIHPYFFSLSRLSIPRLYPAKFPTAHRNDYKPMLDFAHKTYPHEPWFFGYSGFEFVVFPSAYVEEIRRLPARTASLVDFLTNVQFGGWRLIGTDESSSVLHKVASTDLARGVGLMGRARGESAKQAWEAVFTRKGGKEKGKGKGKWVEVSLIWTVLDVVARTGAMGLVGEPLASDTRWLTAVKVLPVTVGIGVVSSSYFPRLLRPFVANLSYFPAYLVHRWMRYLARPTVEKAIREAQEEITPKEKGKVTFVNLLVARYKPAELDVDQVIRDVITASFESTPTTGASLYWMLTELLIRPELVEELREEVLSVLDEDGNLPQTQLTELVKLDSFMRESARINTFHYREYYFIIDIRFFVLMVVGIQSASAVSSKNPSSSPSVPNSPKAPLSASTNTTSTARPSYTRTRRLLILSGFTASASKKVTTRCTNTPAIALTS